MKTILNFAITAALFGCTHSPALTSNSAGREIASLGRSCGKIDPAGIGPSANAFLRKKKLLNQNETWSVNYVIENQHGCFLILQPSADRTENTAEIITFDSQRRMFRTVEDAFKVPQVLQTQIGRPNDTTSFYFAELTGDSALAAFKAILAGAPFAGLQGCVDVKIIANTPDRCDIKPTGKVEWDPSPRSWKLSHSRFSLRKGNTNEVDDIYSADFDSDFSGTICGTLGCPFDGKPRGSLGPWKAILRRYFDKATDRWVEVVMDPVFRHDAPKAPTHEIRFKGEANGSACYMELLKLNISEFLVPVESGPPGFPPRGATVVLSPPFADKLAKIKGLACVEDVIQVGSH